MIKVAEDARKAHALRTRILTALIYPSAVALATFGATIVLLAVVVPALEDLFSGQMDRLPWQTRALVSLSNILRDHYLALSTSSCLAIVIGAGAFRKDLIRRMFERAALKAPVLGPLLESIETVQIATLLATLTHARIPLVTALELLKGGARLKISRSSLSESVASLREGQRLHEALKSVDALSARILDLVQVGELTGKLPELLDEAARDAERRVNASIDRGLAMLTPIMTLLFGGIAGFVLYSVMTAVMSVNSLVEN
jgi:general secretion pathway protein F